MEWNDIRIKAIKMQKQIFANKDKELTKMEYERLLTAAENNKKLYYLMQTICSTGIRVSELRYITTSAVKTGQATISCKGKMRVIILPKELLQYSGKIYQRKQYQKWFCVCPINYRRIWENG